MKKLALLVLLAACEGGITSDAQPRVSVFAEAGDCFAPIGGDVVDPLLQVAGQCPFRLPTQLFAGIDRVKVVEPTNTAFGRDVVWCPPAWANRRVYLRNDKECVCIDLAANGNP